MGDSRQDKANADLQARKERLMRHVDLKEKHRAQRSVERQAKKFSFLKWIFGIYNN